MSDDLSADEQDLLLEYTMASGLPPWETEIVAKTFGWQTTLLAHRLRELAKLVRERWLER